MEEQFIRDRLSKLREEKQVSERKMSLDLGHSTSYIRSITSGRALPSMSEFLYICEYLGTTPMEFFNEEHEKCGEVAGGIWKEIPPVLTFCVPGSCGSYPPEPFSALRRAPAAVRFSPTSSVSQRSGRRAGCPPSGWPGPGGIDTVPAISAARRHCGYRRWPWPPLH